MEFRSAARPLARASRCLNAPFVASRGHKTAARTKRALKIAPHDSFLPDRSAVFPAADSIIYNPPASEATPFHTPSLFIPESDARRRAMQRMGASHPGAPKLAPTADGELPPKMRFAGRNPSYHIGVEQIQEMRRLRAEDPLTWSVGALAKKFECSNTFVQIAAPAPPEHLEWLKEKQARREARWGPIKSKAMEERRRRAEMVMRSEL
jgi:hypothetical protein